MKLKSSPAVRGAITCAGICAVALLGFGAAFAQGGRPDKPPYEILTRYPIGGEGGWDYLAVDSRRHRLFVTRGDTVQVVDAESGTLQKTLTGLSGTHGVALAEDTGFISNGKSDSVTVFDLNSLQVLETVKVTGTGPDAIVYEPAQKRVYTMNHRSGNISVLDAATRKVVATIPALPQLEFAVLDGKGKLFVNSEETGELAVMDLRSATMTAHWKLGECKGPTGLAFDAAHARLFSACANNRMAVVDAASGKLVAELPIGSRPDAVAFDSQLGMVFSSNGDGSLTIIHQDDADHYRVIDNLPTQPGAKTMAMDPLTHRLYLPAALYGPVPAASADNPKPRPPILPGSFNVLVVAPH